MFTRFPDNSHIYQLSPMQARQSAPKAKLWSRRMGTIWGRQAGTPACDLLASDARLEFLARFVLNRALLIFTLHRQRILPYG